MPTPQQLRVAIVLPLLAGFLLVSSRAMAAPLALKCWARPARFLDATMFPAINATIIIRATEGWRSDYEQFWRRMSDGLTMVIARDTGRLEKFDLGGHVQIGLCRTVRARWPGGESKSASGLLF